MNPAPDAFNKRFLNPALSKRVCVSDANKPENALVMKPILFLPNKTPTYTPTYTLNPNTHCSWSHSWFSLMYSKA